MEHAILNQKTVLIILMSQMDQDSMLEKEEGRSIKKQKMTPSSVKEQSACNILDGGDRDTIRKMTGIESAKDRAQITSSTAMSIVHIALLKKVLEFGSENDKYYSYRLAFILTALILQVMAGFIALYIALLRNYYVKYWDDFLDDCSKICCPWSCRSEKKKKQKGRRMGHTSMMSSLNLIDEEYQENNKTCCPFKCISRSYYAFEDEILAMYGDVTENAIRSEIDAANSVSKSAWCTTKVESLKKKLQQ